MERVAGPSTLANIVEFGVGIACLAAGIGAWRQPQLRWAGAALLIAGAAALIHVALQLV